MRGPILTLLAGVLSWLSVSLCLAQDLEIEVVTSPELRSRVEALANVAIPRTTIIFIPGILGSKLIDSANNDEIVWGGTSFNDGRLYYNGKSNLKATVFDEVSIKPFGTKLGISVYGNALEQLVQSGQITNAEILSFAYDWRQSNLVSARDLNSWLCSKTGDLANSEIVFAAHSMGGLVLKNWFIDYFDKSRGCDGFDWQKLKIRKVIFVGTPHYGSPKALKSLFKGYSMFDNWILDRVFSKGLNNYGYSFDSLYELLPIQHDEHCAEIYTDRKVVLPPALVYAADPLSYAGVFSLKFMQVNGLPRQLDDAGRATFYESRLKISLPIIAVDSCRRALYKFPVLGLDKVVTFRGLGTDENTEIAFKVPQLEPGGWFKFGDDIEVKSTARGDGTVPDSSAAWKEVITNANQRHSITAGHGKLMDDANLQAFLFDVLSEQAIEAAVQLKVASPDKYQDLTKSLAEDRKQVWLTPSGGEGIRELAQQINNDIVQERGWQLMDVVAASTASGNKNKESAVLNEYLAGSSIIEDWRKLLAKNKLGKELHDLGYASEATRALTEVVSDSPKVIVELGATQTNLRQIVEKATANAYNTRGVIQLDTGNFSGARSDWKAAKALGSVKASRNLDQLIKMQGF